MGERGPDAEEEDEGEPERDQGKGEPPAGIMGESGGVRHGVAGDDAAERDTASACSSQTRNEQRASIEGAAPSRPSAAKSASSWLQFMVLAQFRGLLPLL
jgi:hypothetical protein